MRSALALCMLASCGRVDFDPAIDAGVTDSASDTAVVDVGADAALVDDVPRGCPASYVVLGASTTRYRLRSMLATWSDAAAICAADGTTTHLVVIANEAERSLVQAAMPMDALWIGLSDRNVASAYRWVTDEPIAYPPLGGPPWDTGEPSMGVGEDCVRTNAVADFVDDSCTAMFAFVCECDAYANDPSRY